MVEQGSLIPHPNVEGRVDFLESLGPKGRRAAQNLRAAGGRIDPSNPVLKKMLAPYLMFERTMGILGPISSGN